MAITKNHREYDIVLVGATGYTGRLTAYHIAQNLPTNLKWAIAGRSSAKLDALADELKHISEDRLQPEIEIVDIEDKAQLTALVARAKVCISVVSYNEVGANVIEACIESRTDYVDTSSAPAAASAPSKIFSHGSPVGELAKSSSVKTKEIILSVLSMPADPSGGTVKSILGRANLDAKTIQESEEPWYLSPVKGHQQYVNTTNLFGMRHDPLLGTLSPSSFSNLQNRAVVHRTWGLLDGGNYYGPNFQYSEYNKVSSTIAGIMDILRAHGINLLFTLAPLRAIAKMILPKPGDGPDVEKEKNSVVEMEALAVADSEAGSTVPKAYARVRFSGGPYTATAAFLAQGAASLLYTRKLEGGVAGGCLTPAFLGADLVERIQGVGAELSIEIL
uniref:Putative trans-acting enoyl reductase n=1 Tax=Talaromyces marneffei PM1 TaxID=1077442 RepID=A0A093VAY0_TALMA